MSLSVGLYKSYQISYDKGKTVEEKEKCVYEANITHNLNTMADKAGIYKALWSPEEIGIKKAEDLIDILRNGLEELKNKPDYFKQFNSPNGWGTYDNFVTFVENYLNACKEYSNNDIYVSR